MRFIHALVPADDRDSVSATLNERNIDHVFTDASVTTGEVDELVVHFPLPAQAVDTVIDELRQEGLDESFLVIGNAEAARTPHFQELEARYVEGEEEDDSVSDEEIRAKAINLNPGRRTYYAMTLLSVLVATVGLLLNAPAIVVGSMVIAPQVGAALTASVGLAFSDRGMIVDGMRSQVLGLGVAILFAIGFGYVLKILAFAPKTVDVATISQIGSRTSPGVLSLIVGICAGAAGAFGLSTDLPVSLVGVAVAAALIPAAGAVGIGIAWGYPVLAFGALVLLVVNLLSIVVSGAAALWYLGYRPDAWEEEGGVSALRSGAMTASIVSVLAICLVTGAVGTAIVEQSTFENRTNDAVTSVLDDARYEHLEVLSVQADFTHFGVGPDEREVSVVVSRPSDEAYPYLADRLEQRIEDATDTNVTVTVEYVDQSTTRQETTQVEARTSQSSSKAGAACRGNLLSEGQLL